MQYTQSELEKAFKLVKNPLDWKDIIDREVETDDPELIVQAIIHFTATVPQYYRVRDNWWRFYSDGYRLGPAGDY